MEIMQLFDEFSLDEVSNDAREAKRSADGKFKPKAPGRRKRDSKMEMNRGRSGGITRYTGVGRVFSFDARSNNLQNN